MLNERDGGIGGVQDRTSRNAKPATTTRRAWSARNRSRARTRRSITPYLDRHHAAADPEGGGRQDPDPVDGLWPVGLGGRQGLPVDLQSAGDLLGRHVDRSSAISAARKAASTSSRARPSASSSSTAATAASRSRCSQQLAKDYGFNVKQYPVPARQMQDQSAQWLSRSPRSSGLDDHVGLGRHEPDRGQASRRERLSDGSLHRRLVVGPR